jgi:multimeric flavodoxin WrbA
VKRVTAFVGSPRKRHTYEAVQQFLSSLQALGDIESEIVLLADYQLKTCRGCQLCFVKGEECCPCEDDRNLLIDKMLASDGVVLASPNYSFQVSALMKTFLDRLGFVFHRPRFFGKVCTSLVVQGIYGGPKIVEYLDFVGHGLGFNVVRGSCLTALDPLTEKAHRTIERTLAAHSRRFHERLRQPPYPIPTLFQLMLFRKARTSIARMLHEANRDYTYYRDQGWFDSDYFYPARLNVFKKAAGRLFDYTTTRRART